jgi:propionyl-CoA carboxylase beta chain
VFNPGGEDAGRDTFELYKIVPGDVSKKYDMHDVIKVIVDHGDYLELKDEYAKNLITCFARIDGHSVGIVANNPSEPGGILERNSCDKYYRFLSVLDAYNIPLINLVDTPPYVPGENEEKLGLLRHGGKIIDLYATTTIPKISIVLRQAYGDGGAFIMGVSKSMGTDICYAWPNAIMAVEISEMNIHKAYKGGGVEEDAYESYLGEVREKVSVFDVANTWTANVIDEVIDPGETRKKIIEAIEVTKNKQEILPMFPKSKKGHGVPPG